MSLLSTLDNRLNPVLVKEVRQAVRGRFFRFSFLLMLIVSSVVSALMLTTINNSSFRESDSGPQYFFGMLLVFAATSMVLVPLHANRAMAGERDDRTFDALLISGLKPAQIVQGKWLASGLLLLLFTSTASPFLIVGFTLFGLDILTGLLLIIFTCCWAMTLSLLGILIACAFKNKAIQSIALAFNALLCVWAVIMWSIFSGFNLFSPFGTIPLRDLLLTAGVVFVGANLLNLWGYGLTISLITHPEENRLLRVRIANLLLAAFSVVVAFMVWVLSGDSEAVAAVVMISYFVLLAFNIPLLTESDHLGVRCRHQIGKGRWRRPLAWLFLPGGTTGARLFLLQLLIVSIPLLVPHTPGISGLGGGTLRINNDGISACIAALVVIPFIALLPGAIASKPECSIARRHAMRVLIPTLLPLIALFSLVLGVLGDDRSMANGETVINPIWFIGHNWNSMRVEEGFILWGALAVLVLVMHVSRSSAYMSQLRRYRPKLGKSKPESEAQTD